jgi:hypothetical protein
MSPHAEALAVVEAVLTRGGEPDDVVREVVEALHARLGRYARLRFVEGGGPAAGAETETRGVRVRYGDAHVADLELGGELSVEDRELLEHVARLIAEHALVAWDTGGEAWEP